MKIAKNNCYGGFSVSEEVAQKLKAKGHKVGQNYPSTWVDPDGTKIVKSSYYIRNETFGIKDDNYDAWRTHPDLIEAIETSVHPSGALADISVEDIPDDVEWEIDEYDGVETIHEVHRSW